MREILGKAKTIRELLSGAKNSIDYYQREYRWQNKQVSELIDDLTGRFQEDYEEGHAREKVETYGHYFLGSIIISHKNGQNFIIDGQQRLTTLTLLLIYLHNLQKDREDAVHDIEKMIFSQKYGKKSFNIDVEERLACMEAIFEDQPFDDTDSPESIQNILARYDDNKDLFPSELTGDVLPYFIDWLIENVHLVEITAYSDEDAYTIFETMNDRGLSLTPTEMLKGYLLANISDSQVKTRVNGNWKRTIDRLTRFGKDEDADFFKAWLRSQRAKTIRERKKDATPGDFDRIGTEFHRWVRDNREGLGLAQSADFVQLVEHEVAFYAREYMKIRGAGSTFTQGLEHIFYNAQNGFIAAGLSSFSNKKAQLHHQGFDQARGVSDPKKARKKMRAKDRPLENDFVTTEAFDQMLLAWFGNASRVLKPGGSFYIWGGYANLGNYPAPLAASGLYFSQGIVWDKQHPVLTRKDNRGRRVERVAFAWRRGQVVAV